MMQPKSRITMGQQRLKVDELKCFDKTHVLTTCLCKVEKFLLQKPLQRSSQVAVL
jgi:hypothetical protein